MIYLCMKPIGMNYPSGDSRFSLGMFDAVRGILKVRGQMSEKLEGERKIWSGLLLTELSVEDFEILCAAASVQSTIGAEGYGQGFDHPLPRRVVVKTGFLTAEKENSLVAECRRVARQAEVAGVGFPPLPLWFLPIAARGYSLYSDLGSDAEVVAMVSRFYGWNYGEPRGGEGVCYAEVSGMRPGFRTRFEHRDLADFALSRMISRDFASRWENDPETMNRYLPEEDVFEKWVELGREFRNGIGESAAENLKLWEELRGISTPA